MARAARAGFVAEPLGASPVAPLNASHARDPGPSFAGSLVVSPRREAASPPVIKLGPEFAHLAGYSERLPHLPDCVDLEHLTVSGNVFFGEGVVLKGTVIIVAENGARIDVPDGAVLQDKVISGALRIVDH